MFNLDNLNKEHPEVIPNSTWNKGQVPKSPDSLIESPIQLVDRGRFRFEVGDSSNGPQLFRIEAQSNNLSNPQDTSTQHPEPTRTDHGPNIGEKLGPCPVRDAGIRTLSNLGPISFESSNPSPISMRSNPYPLSCFNGGERSKPATKQNPRNRTHRKRFHKEIGRLGRNIHRKLLCGFYQKESTNDSHIEDT